MHALVSPAVIVLYNSCTVCVLWSTFYCGFLFCNLNENEGLALIVPPRTRYKKVDDKDSDLRSCSTVQILKNTE